MGGQRGHTFGGSVMDEWADAPRVVPTDAIGRAQGLPSGQVHRIAQAIDGRMLFAGPAGLAIYDGARIQVLARRHGLRCAGLRTISADRWGRAWIGSDAGVDCLHAGGRVEALLAGMLVERCEALTEDLLLIGTSAGLVLLGRGGDGRWHRQQSWRIGFVRDMVADGGRIWVLTGSGAVGCMEDGRLQMLPVELPPELNGPMCIAPATEDAVWVGARRGVAGLDRRSGTARMVPELAHASVQCLLQQGERLLAGTGAGVLACRPGSERREAEAVLLPTLRIRHMMADRDGDLWIGTDTAGVFKVSRIAEAITIWDKSVTRAVFSIRPDPLGGTLVGSESGVVHLADGEHGSRVARPSRGMDLVVWDCLRHSSGEILVAAQSGLYRIVGGSAPRPVSLADPLAASPGRCVLERPDGTYWATVTGLLVQRGSLLEPVAGEAGAGSYVYHLEPTGPDDAWVCTLGSGLLRLSGGRLERPPVDGLGEEANVYAMAESPDGRLAVCADDALYLRTEPGEPLERIAEGDTAVFGWAACWDRDTLWVGTSEGLAEFRAPAFERARTIRPFSMLGGWEFTTPRSLRLAGPGRLWCGLHAGLVHVDVGRIDARLGLPRLALQRVRSQPDQARLAAGTVRIGTGNWRLLLEFAPLWYADEQNLRYRYRLLGFSELWTEWSPEGRAEFTCLPRGSYVLEVQAGDSCLRERISARLCRIRVEDAANQDARRRA